MASFVEDARAFFFRNLLGEGHPPLSRDLLMDSPEAYARARFSRHFIRAARAWSVSGGEMLVAPQIALDNRLLIPPFLPSGRNCEGILAMVLRRTQPDAFIGHLPFAIVHDPGPLERLFA